MGAFNLADVLRETNAQDLGQEGREQIQYIDIDLIDPDPKNFYELSDLDELAANIELVGLQQPLRVRKHPENPDRWMIVSGHRRRAAIRQLVDEGKDQLRAVACIVEQPAASEALQELRLIYANSDTRRMTSAEISTQAERVEMLLYELKEQGMEFPGRMRDHVAEACKVSKSKLSRLKVIRDNLDPSIKKYFDSGVLKESPAYELAKLDQDLQRMIFDCEVWKPGRTPDIGAWTVKNAAELYQKWSQSECKKTETGKCTHAAKILEKHGLDRYSYNRCDYTKCCSTCFELPKCKGACPLLAEKAKKLKAEQKEAKKKERAAAAMTDAQEVEKVKNIWARFGKARTEAGKSTKEVYKALGDYWTSYFEERDLANENGTGKIHKSTVLPYGIHVWEAQKLIVAADLLGVTTDYLLGRSEMPQPPVATLESAESWRDYDTAPLPDENEEAIVLYQLTPNTKLETKIAYFRDGYFRSRDYHVMVPNVRFWQPYHDPNKNVPDSGTREDRRSEE